jgi:protein O-GlcNAc transferase
MRNASSDPGWSTAQAMRNALACYQDGRLREAAEICVEALRAYAGNFDALHLLGLVNMVAGEGQEAVRLLAEATKLRPRSHEAVNNLGLALFAIGDPAGAMAQYDRALALRTNFPEAWNNRGNALRVLGRLDEALDDFELALEQRSDYAEALTNRGAVLLELGYHEEALASCEQAIATQPDYAEAHFIRGNALAALGRLQRSLAAYNDAVRLDPTHAAAHANKSAIFIMLGRHEDALAAGQAAIAQDPQHVDALINCGAAAQHLGRWSEAIAAYDKALAEAPHTVIALRNRAAALRRVGRHAAALADCDELLETLPDDPDALCARGEVLRLLGRHAEALVAFEQALTIDPRHPQGLSGAAFTARNLCDFSAAERLAREIATRIEGGMVVPTFILLHLFDDPRLHLIGAKNYVAGQIPKPQKLRIDPARRNDRITVAYLSADFYQHPIAHLMVEMFEKHDRTRFEVVGVSYGSDDGSDLRKRIVDGLDGFHDIREVSDRDAARIIQALRTDIVVDLTGYTQACRPGVLACRPAPIAVNYLGYPGTMGAGFIDYVIADPVTLPFDQQPFYVEKIVHLPDAYQPFDSRRRIAAEAPTRQAAGLTEQGVVFCCFNNAFKITREIFELWMRLLGRVEGSVLWLLLASEAARDHLRHQATQHNIDPARLVFAERVPPEEHLARHRLADLFLDTLPYNAHSTAREALWTGVPLITCPGKAFAGRVGASLLTAAGMPDLIVPDLAAYEALAHRLATEPEALAECRQRLERQRSTAPLFATDRFVRYLEAAYVTMYALGRSRKPPQSFAVPAD